MEPYEGTEPYIFISYARKDWGQASPFLDALSGAGYRVWYDVGIQAGAHWTETLVEKIEGCAAFCPLISRAFNASDFCFEETDYAFGEKKTIVPVYLEALEKKDLRPLYRLLHVRQDLRLYDCADAAQFAERLGREQAFAPCKVPEWHKVGQIKWRLGADGVLSIAINEDFPWYFGVSIPSYQRDTIHGTTAPWAPYREKILSLEIENYIKTIGDYAFAGCINLTSVHIPDSVTKIGEGAFMWCTKLKDVCIPDSVTEIGQFAFRNCDSLTDVRIPDGVTAIGEGAFVYCRSLKSVRISGSVTVISNHAFHDCDNLTDLHILNGVTIIDDSAFRECKSLTDVHIPDSVTKIGYGAFILCDNLKSIEIPIGAEVDKDAFPYHTHVRRR